MVKTKQKLARLTKVLIFDEALLQIVKLFFDTFLASYFYQVSPQSIFQLALYGFVSYLSTILIVVILRNFIKRCSKVWLYRLGVLIQLAFTLFVIIMGEHIVDHVVLLGILYGVRGATNGFIANLFIAALIPKAERPGYYGYSAAILGVANIVFPLLFGAYITITSFQDAAIAVVFLSGLRLINSFFIKDTPRERRRFSLAAFLKVFKRDRQLRKLFIIEFLKGINLYGVMGLLATLLIVMHSENDLALGGWVSAFYIGNVIAMLLFARKYRREYKTPVMILLLILTTLGSLAILLDFNLITVIIYNISYYIGARLIEYITNIDVHDRATRKDFYPQHLMEFYTVREFLISSGRLIGYGALMAVAIFANNNLFATNLLFAFISASLVTAILLSLTLRRR